MKRVPIKAKTSPSLLAASDRRAHQTRPEPRCPTCRASGEAIEVLTRTGYLLFLKCRKCRRVWQVEKPPPRGQRRWDP